MAAHPSTFYADLTDQRLRHIAARLLEVRHDAHRELRSEYDDNYTRETTSFGRSRNMLIQECLSSNNDWLQILHAGMDLTFSIGIVPCRFFRDDSDNPEKHGFFRRNAVDDLFASDDKSPVMWRFVVEKALTEDDEDRVLFAGYNMFQEKVAEWEYRQSTPTLHVVGQDVPQARSIPPAPLELRDEDRDDDAQASSAN